MAQQSPGAAQAIGGQRATMGVQAQAGIVAGAMFPVHWTAEFFEALGRQVDASGIASRSLAVQLHRNALVRRFDVRVSAARAEAVLLGNAAQVRQQSDEDGRLTVVADFGTLVTVGSVGVLGAGGLRRMGEPEILVQKVKAWTGLAFASQWLFVAPPTTGTVGSEVATFGETRTERLLIEVSGTDSLDEVLEKLWVELPDPPTDLSLRIDDGPPVWSWPGPVRPGQGKWKDGAQTVELGPALAALTGDPDDHSAATFTLTLTSRTPGRLGLEAVAAGRDLSYLARVRPGGSDSADLAFELEGARRVPLPLPAWTAGVERVALTAAAAPGPERAVPPVGPDAAGTADLVLDADRSACVRLPAASGLAELVALRLPLRAGPAGAEARVVLLAARADGEPGEPLEGAVSRPVTLDPPPAGAPAAEWRTFELPAPLALEGPAPWAAVQVARGQVEWPLGEGVPAEPGVAVPDRALRRGPPAGPWQPLPGVVRALGGRVRVVGHAAKDAPLAPLVVQVEGKAPLPAADPAAVRVTPTARGVPVEWPAASVGAVEPVAAGGAKSVDLVVTSHLPGVVALRDVVVTAKR